MVTLFKIGNFSIFILIANRFYWVLQALKKYLYLQTVTLRVLEMQFSLKIHHHLMRSFTCWLIS